MANESVHLSEKCDYPNLSHTRQGAFMYLFVIPVKLILIKQKNGIIFLMRDVFVVHLYFTQDAPITSSGRADIIMNNYPLPPEIE